MAQVPNPGLRSQPAVRTSLRIGGAVFVFAGIALIIMWITGFSSTMDSVGKVAGRATMTTNPNDVGPIINEAFATSSSAFGRTWMMMGGVFCLAIGAGMLRAGFLGTSVRYMAGETMPVVKDSISYLTDGEGLMGMGRIVDDGSSGDPGHPQGLFCQKCGTRNDLNAHFCDACGQQLVR